ncbi:MAG: filamentous hemagglutinin N-terminal domain-containing protein [Methylovirgula sp.]
MASVSALALLTAGAPVRALQLATMRGGGAVAAQAAAAAAMASVQQAQQATQQSMSSLLRATQAIQAMQQTQAAARALAQKTPSNVRNGLTTGGLQVAPGIGTDPSLWQNANLPSQNVSDGQTTVTIQQTAQKAILTWSKFNVGQQTTVYFNQSAGNTSTGNDWIALNRVIDPSGVPSQILGQIKAEGTVYIINQNGVIFGGASQVNVNSLLVSSLPFLGDPANLSSMTPGSAAYDAAVQIGNSNFLNLGLTGLAPGVPFLGSQSASLSDVQSYGNITVDVGAQIEVGGLGYAMLAAPNVSNAGTILAPDGQVILAAGMQVILAVPQGDTSNSWLSPALIGPDGAGIPVFTATNTGLIQATTGNVTILGAAISQAGVVAVTTSITRPGEIDLTAADEGLDAGFASAVRTGPLVFVPGSVTAVLPDEDGETTTSDQAANTSFTPGKIKLAGGEVIFDNGSLMEAPGAAVTILAQAGEAGAVTVNGDVPAASMSTTGR